MEAMKDCWMILGVVHAGKDAETCCKMCCGQVCSWWTRCTRVLFKLNIPMGSLIIITSFGICQTNVLHLERAHLYYGRANISACEYALVMHLATESSLMSYFGSGMSLGGREWHGFVLGYM